MRKTVSGLMLALLLSSLSALAFNIQPVKAQSNPIYISDNGIVGTASIYTNDNVTYTFTDNINGSPIIVEKDNITIDGAGHTLEGSGQGEGQSYYGITLSQRTNVTITNLQIDEYYDCIYLTSCSDDIISGNNLTNSVYGIAIEASSNNTISENNFTGNAQYNVAFFSSSYNEIVHNNFIGSGVFCPQSVNIWNLSYPYGGNFWSSYHGTDDFSGPDQNVSGSDGIGDALYTVNPNNKDYYPLMTTYSISQLSVTISPQNPPDLRILQHMTFNSTVSGGTVAYAYQWYLNDTPLLNATGWTWTFWSNSTPGFYTVCVSITDSENQTATSNTATVNVYKPIYDVEVTNVYCSREFPSHDILVGQGQILNLTVTIENLGNQTDSRNVTATAVVFSHTLREYQLTQSTSVLMGMSINLTFTWNTTNWPIRGICTLDSFVQPIPAQTSGGRDVQYRGGNITITIPGDINGDFKVDLMDLVLLANSYGTTPASVWGTRPHQWDPGADINGDGKVDLSDLVILATHYGQHNP